MRSTLELIPQLQQRLPYQIVEGAKGKAAVAIGGKIFSLQEISSYILNEVRTVAEGYIRPDGRTGSDHGAGLLQRRSATGGARGRGAGGLEGRADRQ